MRRTFFISLLAVIGSFLLSAAVPKRYFVGQTEVPASFWRAIPDSLKSAGAYYNRDTVIVEEIWLPISLYLDSTSAEGDFSIKKRNPEDVRDISERLQKLKSLYDSGSFKVNEGQQSPQISLVRYSDGVLTDSFIQEGKCYLFSFWATWCGNCLIELQKEFIPSVAKEFADRDDFVFVPVCIDSDAQELDAFFTSGNGQRWDYLSDITYLDTAREANSAFGQGGVMPLNVVVGKNGIIRLIHSGRITDVTGLDELRNAIRAGLETVIK